MCVTICAVAELNTKVHRCMTGLAFCLFWRLFACPLKDAETATRRQHLKGTIS